MLLEGSCHCRAVRFRVRSHHPYPFNLCYCSICRKTAGTGGYAINLGAVADTLAVEGADSLRSYTARLDDDGQETSTAERKFCGICGSALWLYDPTWPELVHPHAAAIDTPLPAPPERVHLMLAHKAPWVEPCIRPGDSAFDGYPEESIAAWHDERGLSR
jgi:hypothetical protein